MQIPDFYRAVAAACGQVTTVRAERDAMHFLAGKIEQFKRSMITPPLEVVPFPVAKTDRAFLEQLLGLPDVRGLGGEFPMRPGDPAEVEVRLQDGGIGLGGGARLSSVIGGFCFGLGYCQTGSKFTKSP